MIPWELLDSAPVPGTNQELGLYKRGQEFSIRMGGREIMGSRAHGSEEALSERACDRIAGRPRPCILVGGLGLGYTVAAALQRLGPGGRVIVAELVPAVVQWNRGPLAHLAGYPLQDRRLTIMEGDVVRILQAKPRAFDAILLDVDNGPEDLIRKGNDRLYDRMGLEAIRAALRPGGVLGVWSAGPDRAFVQRLERGGFRVEEVRVRVRTRRPLGGRQHTIWLAAIPDRPQKSPLPTRRSLK
jgi:spermidine synthase